jgi:hypothetical protein
MDLYPKKRIKKKPKVKQASVLPGASLWSIVTAAIAPAIRKRTVHSLRGFGYEQDWLSVIGSFIGGGGDFTDSQVKDMIERVYPSGLKKGTIRPWKKGDLEKGERPPERVAERMDMMLMAADMPQKYDTMKESMWQPTKGKESKDKFYTFRDKNQMGQIFHGIKNKEGEIVVKGLKEKIPYMEEETARRKAAGEKTKMFNVGYSSDVEKGAADFSWSKHHVGMERFQVGVGEDPMGKYMSIYDPWDIAGGELTKGVFPGFQIYDRRYYEFTPPEQPDIKRAPPPEFAAPQPVSVPTGQLPTGTNKVGIDDKIMNFLHKMI